MLPVFPQKKKISLNSDGIVCRCDITKGTDISPRSVTGPPTIYLLLIVPFQICGRQTKHLFQQEADTQVF